MAYCDTPIILDISLWESRNPRIKQYFQWLHTTCWFWLTWLLVWFEMVICIQWQLMAKCDQHKCNTLLLWQLGKLPLPRKRMTKGNVEHKTPSVGRERSYIYPLQWRHNGRDSVSNHQPGGCFLNRFIQTQIRENIKAPRHWPLCGEFTGDRWIPRTNGQ